IKQECYFKIQLYANDLELKTRSKGKNGDASYFVN
ncbi:unnamed protein product, partial [marine sediment metagenome]